ncbi:MAG TPA: phenylalanine--tRNA ligase subunit beta, partial [Dehalococcoidia bacterium]|nr:phenylalanine--tRNA ligase subunit beta [Dehalococcoidia bacterium]
MRVSLRWLSDYVPIPESISPAELAHRLTMAGIEVGAVETTAAWDNVFVGQISRLDKHPNADRLVLATVSLGDREQTVVTGAPNLAVGQKVPFALVGAVLYSPKSGGYEELRPAKLRGVVSEGMVCSEVELGLGEDHSGIRILPETAPVGRPLRDYLGDAILDCELTPNRPDCLSMLGIGHEVAALTGGRFTEPDLAYPTTDVDAAEKIAIEIADPDLCARYVGAYLEGVKVGPSPDWLQQRLTAAGMRPINNIVDVTNYVMLEYGQPLHAFDYDLIRGRKIIVRRAWPGERLRTLDGADRQLVPDILVIADAEGAVAIAGVMGGESSEVSAGTTRVLLEAANFNNISIRRTSQQLKLRSEASSRFDKGISPELIDRAARRAVQLMVELSGASAAKTWVDAYPRPRERRPIPIGRADIRRILGVEWEVDRIRATLEGLDFACTPDPGVP